MKTLTFILTGLLILDNICALSQAGSLDTSFGTNGKVIKPPKGVPGTHEHSMVLQPDGKILFAGGIHAGVNTDFFLVRYKQNGSIDKSFWFGRKSCY